MPSTLSTVLVYTNMEYPTSDKWDIPWYTTRERYITILYHDIENTLVNTIDATNLRRMMGRLDVIVSNATVFLHSD